MPSLPLPPGCSIDCTLYTPTPCAHIDRSLRALWQFSPRVSPSKRAPSPRVMNGGPSRLPLKRQPLRVERGEAAPALPAPVPPRLASSRCQCPPPTAATTGAAS
uniref:Uncharacterized protein n=1 Tax=Knipowitschia caucasica TaxID=637954 RepID=A0AAV2JFL0_KNICA